MIVRNRVTIQVVSNLIDVTSAKRLALIFVLHFITIARYEKIMKSQRVVIIYNIYRFFIT